MLSLAGGVGGSGTNIDKSSNRHSSIASELDNITAVATAIEEELKNEEGYPTIYPTWRLKERMKTVGVCLVLALNIGTDPPDIHKPNPCATLQCWLDPK
eukprot:12885422-Ditylum_brightwellii.AAC.1